MSTEQFLNSLTSETLLLIRKCCQDERKEQRQQTGKWDLSLDSVIATTRQIHISRKQWNYAII